MSDVNETVGSRKLRVTVTVEEVDAPKSTDSQNPNESWSSVKKSLKEQMIEVGLEGSRRFFWWLL